MWLINTINKMLHTKSAREVLYVYCGALLNGISLFLINVVLGRSLEKTAFGIFSLSLIALSTVAELSDLGLNGGLLRFVPLYLGLKEEIKLKQLVKTIWQWRVGLSVLLTVGGVVLSGVIANGIFKQPVLAPYIAFSFLGVGGVVLLGFVTTYLQATQQFLYNATIQSAKGLVRLLFVVGLIMTGVHNIFVYLSVYIGIPWILFLVTVRVLPASFSKVKIDSASKKQLHHTLLRFSFWLTIWSLSAIVASRIDQAMLSRFLGLEEVATYTVAFQFVFVYSLALQSITAVLTPKINALTTVPEVWLFVKKIMRWLVPTTVLVALFIYPSQYVVRWLFGMKYAQSLPIYLLLSYSMLINFLAAPLGLIITVFNRTELIAFSGFLQLLLNIGLSYVLIPRYGSFGAGLTFLVGIGVSQCYTMACSFYLLKTQPFPTK